jgi:glycosyltransferase involved in cell wall biosynthesis
LTGVSVITAVHPDKVSFLSEAYASVVAQQGVDWTWLLQIDGRGAEIPVSLERDARVHIAATGVSMGTAATRNRALLRVETPLTVNLDADDLLEPGALAVLGEAVSRRRSIGFVWGDVVDFAPDGSSELAKKGSPYPLGCISPGVIEAHWLKTGSDGLFFSGICWRTDVLLEVGGWSALPGMEDTDLVLAASHKYAGFRIPDVVQRYRIHRDQTTLSDFYIRERERNRTWIWKRVRARRRLAGRESTGIPPDPSIGPARARAIRLRSPRV